MPSLLTGWIESSFIHNKQWVLDWLIRLNPTIVKICALPNPDGTWDFSFADTVASSLPNAEIIYRPYAANENTIWLTLPAVEWITRAAHQLGPRPYRVTFGCEPSFEGEQLTRFLAYSVALIEEAAVQGIKIDLWGIQPQALRMFTSHEDDITKGKWDTLLRTAGKHRGTVTIDYHTYTGLVLPAGTYDDSYLRRIATEPELLRDEKTWATWEQIQERPYQTRHLFRHRWLNLRAKDIGAPEHDYFIGESPFDWYGEEWDLRETWSAANAIAGGELDNDVNKRVAGINTLYNFTRWKFPQWTFEEAILKQLAWYGKLLANDPRCKGWALYALTDKEGDQQSYNWLRRRSILEGCIGLNPVVSIPVPAPTPAPIPTPAPLYLHADRDYVNLRPEPTLNNTPLTTVTPSQRLKVIGPENAQAMVGHIDMWIQVQTPEGIMGWIAAWLLRLETTAPPPAPPPPAPAPVTSWRDSFDVTELTWIDREIQRDSGGILAKFVALLQ